MKVYFVEKEGGYPFYSDSFLYGAENYPLSKAMVNHDQQRIKTRGHREVGDKVIGDLLEGARCVGHNWCKWRDGGVCV